MTKKRKSLIQLGEKIPWAKGPKRMPGIGQRQDVLLKK